MAPPARATPVVVEPDEAAASLSSDDCVGRAVWLLFSPQCEKVTVPWMAEEPLPPGLVTSSIGSGLPLAGM